jgi:hypothetical protein
MLNGTGRSPAEIAGVNCYLTLGNHAEPKVDIQARVQCCFDESQRFARIWDGDLASVFAHPATY